MSVLVLLALAGVVLGGGGWVYSRVLARLVGEDSSRATPAWSRQDGRDYVPTPTPVVFAHHFASIAGAGPIIGPVIAVVYGWAPALLWVVFGGVLIGAVHDYLTTFMATREGGQSIATIARRMLGNGAFVGMTLFLIVMLALVCATFLNLSAAALTSMLDAGRLDLRAGQTLLRTVGDKVVIGGIASMSVVIITAAAPLVGWMYIRRKVRVLWCSLAATAICGVSIVVGLYWPIALPQQVHVLGLVLSGVDLWRLMLSAYVLVAAGAPVWFFLQSRDFINVHILYAGMAALVAILVAAGIRGQSPGEPIPAFNVAAGSAVHGGIWPGLFILIACGAVSGFHSLCAGGTTSKQLTSERAARRIGYFGMILESFLAVCVIAVMIVGQKYGNYMSDLYPKFPSDAGGNAVLAFAMGVGNAGRLAFGLPVAAGAVAGMVLLEGFLVTTLDTAVRLTRYLIEEVWRVLLGRFDVFAQPLEAQAAEFTTGEGSPAGSNAIPTELDTDASLPRARRPIRTSGLPRAVLTLLRHYWVNSGLAVALMLVFAFTGGQNALWGIFATSNQLLAGFGLSLAALWLARQGRRSWFAAIPAVAMMVTTVVNLVILLGRYLNPPAGGATPIPLLVADVVILAITAYLLACGARAVVGLVRNPPPAKAGALGQEQAQVSNRR